MARQVLPIVGGIVGAYFGYPQLGFVIGGLIGGAVDPQINKGPSLGELPVQSSNEGFPRAIIYGTATCTGYILAFGPPIKTTEMVSGEKGAPKTEQEVVYRNYAIAICEGPIAGILRVWENDKLVYDVRPGSAMLQESAQWLTNKFIYLGTEDQTPNVFMEQTITGVGSTPAYRGTAYMYVNLEDLTDTRGAIKQYRWEVAMTITGGEWAYDWVQAQATTWASIPAIARSNTVTVASGGGVANTIWRSTDLETWSGAVVAGLSYLASNGTSFVGLVAGNNSAAWYSMNGAIWSNNPTPLSTERTGVAYGNGRYVIVDYSGSDFYTHTGDGAGAWNQNSVPINIAGRPRFGNGTFVTLQSSMLAYSSDGVTWAQYPHPYVTAQDILWVQELGLWILLGGTTTGRVATSPNLATWTVRTTPNELYKSAAWSPELGVISIAGDAGSFATSPDGINWTTRGAMPTSSYVDMIWDPVNFKFAAVGTGTSRISVSDSQPPSVGGLPVALGDIVADLHDRSTIPVADYDVSELTDMVDGLTLTGDYTAASAIDTLRSCYFFDKAEPGDKLYYPKRGKAVVATLDIDDLVELPDLSKREQVIELPKKVHLMFQNPTAGYAPVKSSYERSSVDVLTVAESTVQVPVVLSMDAGQQLVHKMMKLTTADAQGEITLSVPDGFLRLVPSDCIGLSLRGQVRRLRIDDISMQDGRMDLKCRVDRQSAYTSDLTGIPIPEPTLPPSTIVGQTTFVYADVPARIESEDDLNYLVAGTGTLPGWYGWMLQRSLDGGANYLNVEQFNRADVIGLLTNTVADADENYTDTTNTVVIELLRDDQSLESLTDAQFLSEGGSFLLEKADGTFEVMQYRDAEEDSNGRFILSHLSRGRLNSGTASHSSGDRFVLLETAHHIPAQSAWIGQDLTHRPVSLGESPETALEYTDTYVGRSQIEWPVASFTLSRVADTVTASWAPRHRFGTDDAPVASINFQGYRVTIVGTSTLTFDTTAQTFTQDVSAIGGSVTVSVAALNRITGAGPATSGTI